MNFEKALDSIRNYKPKSNHGNRNQNNIKITLSNGKSKPEKKVESPAPEQKKQERP